MADIEEWLGGKFGRDGAKELRVEMVQNFTIGAAAKVWALDDVPAPEKEGTLTGQSLRAASSLYLRSSWIATP